MNTVEAFKIEDVELGDKEIRYTNTLVLEGLYNDKPMIIRGLNIEEAKDFKMLNSDVPALTGNQIVISEKQAKDFGFSQGQKIKVVFEDKEYEFDIVKIVENRGLNSIYDEYPMFICNIDEIAKIRNISSELTDCLFIDVVEEGAAKEYAEYLT